MQTFIVERQLSGIQAGDLYQMAAAAHRQAIRKRGAGARIYYLGSTFLPDDGACLCLFEARDRALVEDLNREANLPFLRVRAAMLLAQAPALVV